MITLETTTAKKSGLRRLRKSAAALLMGTLAAPAAMVVAPGGTAGAATAIDTCARVGRDAGFTMGPQLVKAVAIAMAESSCNPGATHKNSNGSTDYGLWQINSIHLDLFSKSCLLDAQCNANAAYQLSSGGTKWSPWSVYNSGVYKNHLASAQTSVNTLAGSNILGNAGFENSNRIWGPGNGTTGWNYTVYSSSNAIDGTHIGATSTSVTGTSLAQTQPWTPTAGRTYTLSMWVRASSGTKKGTVALWALGGTPQSVSKSFSVGTTWTKITVSGAFTSGHNSLKAEMYLGTKGPDYYVDAVNLH